MNDTLTTAAAVQQALNDCDNLIKSSATEQLTEEEIDNSETVYSLASLYSQFATDPAAAEEAILQALTEKYGEEYL